MKHLATVLSSALIVGSVLPVLAADPKPRCGYDNYPHDEPATSRGFEYTLFINAFPAILATANTPCSLDPGRLLFQNAGAMTAAQRLDNYTVFSSTSGLPFVALIADPNHVYAEHQALKGTYYRFVKFVPVHKTNGFDDAVPLFETIP
jgi:hypothetical protein